jgi:hypothetical protein
MVELKERTKAYNAKKALLETEKSLARNDNIVLHQELCCKTLAEYVCLEDSPIAYLAPTRSYLLLMPNDITLDIKYCPCCGAKFPEDLTNELALILEQLKTSYEDKKLPAEFKSSQWWKTLGL